MEGCSRRGILQEEALKRKWKDVQEEVYFKRRHLSRMPPRPHKGRIAKQIFFANEAYLRWQMRHILPSSAPPTPPMVVHEEMGRVGSVNTRTTANLYVPIPGILLRNKDGTIHFSFGGYYNFNE
ncbi:hypothetical protein WN943_023864 [Citrus x changshan-huyou]